MGVWTDEDRIAEACRVAQSAADQGVLHHHDVGAEADLAFLGHKHSPMQDSSPFSEDDGADRRRRCDIGGGWDNRSLAAMLQDHAATG